MIDDKQISNTRPVRTHIANYLGKCKMCDHWTGAGLIAEDDEICDKAKVYCPIWGTHWDSEQLEKIYKED